MNALVTSVRWSTLTLLLMLACVGCGPSAFQKHLSQLQSETKQKHKATDIQAALAPFFADEHMLTNRLPEAVTSLPVFADDHTGVEVVRADCPNVLLLYIGGGFGHWGLLVARPGHDKDICDWHRARATLWANGVYFLSE